MSHLVVIYSENVLLLTRLTSLGHYVVISGYDAATDEFQIQDPASSRYIAIFPQPSIWQVYCLHIDAVVHVSMTANMLLKLQRSILSNVVELDKEKKAEVHHVLVVCMLIILTAIELQKSTLTNALKNENRRTTLHMQLSDDQSQMHS